MTEAIPPSETSIKTKLAKLVSNFFNPLTSFFLYYLYFIWVNPRSGEVFTHLLPIIFILILPISVWILWNVKRGHYSNMDVSNRVQRNSLYLVITTLLLVYNADCYFVHELDRRFIYLTVLILIMQLSNFWIKSSMHTALNIFVAALFYLQNPILGCCWFILALLVGYSRIVLRRHTVPEVLCGAFLALLVSILYLY